MVLPNEELAKNRRAFANLENIPDEPMEPTDRALADPAQAIADFYKPKHAPHRSEMTG